MLFNMNDFERKIEEQKSECRSFLKSGKSNYARKNEQFAPKK